MGGTSGGGWEYLEGFFRSILGNLPQWPPTVSGLEAWWVIIAAIGVLVSAYDIWRARLEVTYGWSDDERAERGIAITSMIKSSLLGLASALNLTAGMIVSFLPPARTTEEGVLASSVLVLCLIVGEVVVVAVTVVRDIERIFVHQFVWTARKRPEGTPPHIPTLGVPPRWPRE